MNNYDKVLDFFEKNDEALNATKVSEGTGLDKKEVSKVMDKLKKEEKIVSPKRCYWQIKK
jgi:predicted transcriptional regulator